MFGGSSYPSLNLDKPSFYRDLEAKKRGKINPQVRKAGRKIAVIMFLAACWVVSLFVCSSVQWFGCIMPCLEQAIIVDGKMNATGIQRKPYVRRKQKEAKAAAETTHTIVTPARGDG